jgi:hypothetical protein
LAGRLAFNAHQQLKTTRPAQSAGQVFKSKQYQVRNVLTGKILRPSTATKQKIKFFSFG